MRAEHYKLAGEAYEGVRRLQRLRREARRTGFGPTAVELRAAEAQVRRWLRRGRTVPTAIDFVRRCEARLRR